MALMYKTYGHKPGKKKNIRNTRINHKIKTGTENSTNATLEPGTMTEILCLGRNTVIYLNKTKTLSLKCINNRGKWTLRTKTAAENGNQKRSSNLLLIKIPNSL